MHFQKLFTSSQETKHLSGAPLVCFTFERNDDDVLSDFSAVLAVAAFLFLATS